ncbi:MAG: LysE family translocator [Candidatus Korobacteraceae bacterium]|jgi:threonine/homoserine/homoserine lactone efflux protein
MTFEVWLAFVAASVIMLLIPGPTVLMVVGDALANRSRRAWATVAGVVMADATAMTLSLAGAGALLQASAAAFTFMKTLGGLYLIYLGVKSILGARSAAAHAGEVVAGDSGPTMLARFGRAYAVTVLNPKSILFFVAFVPQFMSAQGSFLAQSGLLLATFTCLSMLNSSMYSLMASLIGGRLTAASAQRKVSYAGGCTLIGAGALTLAIRRS